MMQASYNKYNIKTRVQFNMTSEVYVVTLPGRKSPIFFTRSG